MTENLGNKSLFKSIREQVFEPDSETEIALDTNDLPWGCISDTLEYFNEKGLIVKHEEFYSDGSIYSTVSYLYDPEGLLVECTGCYDSESFPWKKTFKYDIQGNIVQEIISENDLEYITFWMYTYGDNGNLVEIVQTINDNHVSISKYGKDGNCIEETYFDIKGRLDSKVSFEYDLNGNLISEIQSGPNEGITLRIDHLFNENNLNTEERQYENGSFLMSIIEYKYDQRRNVIEERLYDGDGVLEEYTLFRYDSFDRIIEEVRYDSTGEPLKKDNYVIKYDFEGNWIEYIEYEEDILIRKSFRQIEYF